MTEPEDVVRHLGKQEKHWREQYSAHALANKWFSANFLPPAVESLLFSHPIFRSAALVDAFLEREVDLSSAGRPSQTDLLAVIGLEHGLAIVAVEGKVDEPFGQFVKDWVAEQTEVVGDEDPADSKTRKARLDGLCATLGLSDADARPLRYQLLHRVASAIYEAKRYRTDIAGMVVHSFSSKETGLDDFIRFARALNFDGEVRPGKLIGPRQCDGVSLFLGWAQDFAPTAKDPKKYLDDLRAYSHKLSDWCTRVRAFCDERSSKL